MIHIAKFGIYHIIKDALDATGSHSFLFVSLQCYLDFWLGALHPQFFSSRVEWFTLQTEVMALDIAVNQPRGQGRGSQPKATSLVISGDIFPARGHDLWQKPVIQGQLYRGQTQFQSDVVFSELVPPLIRPCILGCVSCQDGGLGYLVMASCL